MTILKAVQSGLEKSLGTENAKAVNFYIDPRIAAKDPGAYSASLQRMFGPGYESIITRINHEVCSLLSMEAKPFTNFAECIQAAKQRYLVRD